MFKMVCPKCSLKMKDSIDIFENKNTYYECYSCKASVKVSNTYKKVGELLPAFILTISVIIRRSVDLNTFDKYVVQPIVVAVAIIIAYFLYIGFYPKKLRLNSKKLKEKSEKL